MGSETGDRSVGKVQLHCGARPGAARVELLRAGILCMHSHAVHENKLELFLFAAAVEDCFHELSGLDVCSLSKHILRTE